MSYLFKLQSTDCTTYALVERKIVNRELFVKCLYGTRSPRYELYFRGTSCASEVRVVRPRYELAKARVAQSTSCSRYELTWKYSPSMAILSINTACGDVRCLLIWIHIWGNLYLFHIIARTLKQSSTICKMQQKILPRKIQQCQGPRMRQVTTAGPGEGIAINADVPCVHPLL